MSQLNRLRWKCRRGMLELDLVLNQFLARDFTTLDADSKRAFETLLESGDEALWADITDEGTSANPVLQGVIDRLRAC